MKKVLIIFLISMMIFTLMGCVSYKEDETLHIEAEERTVDKELTNQIEAKAKTPTKVSEISFDTAEEIEASTKQYLTIEEFTEQFEFLNENMELASCLDTDKYMSLHSKNEKKTETGYHIQYNIYLVEENYDMIFLVLTALEDRTITNIQLAYVVEDEMDDKAESYEYFINYHEMMLIAFVMAMETPYEINDITLEVLQDFYDNGKYPDKNILLRNLEQDKGIASIIAFDNAK